MRGAAVKISHFSFRIKDAFILRDVSLEASQGEMLSLVGPNGAGKTTLLRCLAGVLPGGRGGISIKGRPLGDYSRRELARTVSYVPQSDMESIPFSVFEFVLMGRYPHLSPFSTVGPDDEKAVWEALALTNMTGFAWRSMNTLSGGENKKAHIAAALAQDCPIMLLDEPITFLDPKHQAEIQATLARINRERGVTVVFVSHDLNSVALHSRKVAALKDGGVAFEGPVKSFMRREVLEPLYGQRFVFVKHPSLGVRLVFPGGAS